MPTSPVATRPPRSASIAARRQPSSAAIPRFLISRSRTWRPTRPPRPHPRWRYPRQHPRPRPLSRHNMRHLQRWVWITALVLGIADCSKDKSIDEPAKLTPLPATLRVERTWSASVDDKKAVALRLGLSLSADDSHVYAAGHRGDVAAFDLASGHTVWRTRTKAPLSGGTATGQGLVVVGTSDGRLFALDAANGAVRWSVHVSGEVLAPAVISERVIALRHVGGRLHALSVSDGHELWSYEQQVPKLSLRGTSRPVIAGDVLLCGFDNGKVAAVNMSDGSMQWEAIITPPHGRTELERLHDVDSPGGFSGAGRHAGARHRADLVGARRFQLSRPDIRCRRAVHGERGR